EPVAGPPDRRLDLVGHQQRARGVADLVGGRQVAVGRRHRAVLALRLLQEHRRALAGHGLLQRVRVSVRDEPDVDRERAELVADGLLAAQRQGADGTAVEAVLGRHEVVSAGALAVLDRELVGGLVGLRAGVGEEDPGGAAEQGDQPLGEQHLGLVQEQVAGVRDRRDLLRHRLDEGGVGVAERDDRDAGDEVEVLLAVDVPHPGALASGQRDRRDAVVGHEGLVEALVQATHQGTTMVPIPSLVKISCSSEWGTRPSSTWACGTPFLTAVRQDSILGTMPLESVGISRSSSSASSSSMTSVSSGQLAYRPSTSVRTMSFCALSATASAAAAVSALTL